MTTRVLVVDDEAISRRRIRRLLASEADVAIVGECADGASALKAIAADHPDVVFLDVQMPELDGFAVVERVKPSTLPAVVFVTAFDRYAVRAFDVHAIDYLLKPFSNERFRMALARARQRLERNGLDEGLMAFIDRLHARRRYLVRLSVRSGERIVVIDAPDVDWIEAADNYVKLHVGAREYVLRETLGALERRIDPDEFVRIHRSAIVRIDRVAELHPASHGDVDLRLQDGTRLTLSRTFRDRVERALGHRLP